MSLQKLTIAAIVGTVAMLAGGTDAQAFWWRHHSSGGSHGSWGSHGGSWGSHGSSGSHGSWGSHGGLFHRHFHRHHSSGGWGSYGSSGGSYGSSGGYSYGSSGGGYGSSGGYVSSYGSSGGYSSGYGSSGGYSSGYGSSGGYSSGYAVDGGYAVPSQGAPAHGPAADGPADAPAAGGDLPAPDSTRYGSSATLFVSVPADAKVWVNDRLTTSTGTERRFMSSGLESGRTYSYTVRVEMVRNGQTVTDTKVVKLNGGDSSQLAFNMTDEGVRTALILKVPADAKVFLAGKETKATGTVREFATTKLTKGGEWASYPVRVEISRNGETLVKEENVSLAAGETREVAIDFDSPQVADLRK